MILRQECHALGLRYRVDVKDIPGRPDMVFRKARLVIFIDGDFWHGRELEERIAKLSKGHNATYWVAKVTTNVARDRRYDSALTEAGWTVLRFWESDVRRHASAIAKTIAGTVAEKLKTVGKGDDDNELDQDDEPSL